MFFLKNRPFSIVLIFTAILASKYVQSAECPADDLTPVTGSGKIIRKKKIHLMLE